MYVHGKKQWAGLSQTIINATVLYLLTTVLYFYSTFNMADKLLFLSLILHAKYNNILYGQNCLPLMGIKSLMQKPHNPIIEVTTIRYTSVIETR